MNLDLPPHLHATRDFLMASMEGARREPAPEMPASLLEDLTRSLAGSPEPSKAGNWGSLFDSLRLLVGGPAFGAVAAAIAILAVASTFMFSPQETQGTDGFRGAGAYVTAEETHVILVGAPEGARAELEDLIDLDSGNVFTASDAAGIDPYARPAIVVDFTQRRLSAIDRSGNTVYERELPSSSAGISLEIASALSRF